MFVKIENFENGKPLIINVDMINSICPCDKDSLYVGNYELITGQETYVLNEEQCTALCEILTKRL